MVKENILKDKTTEQIEVTLVNDLKALGQKSFDITISPQAKKIISRYGYSFPWEHFKIWWIKRYTTVNGAQLHHYLSTEDGFEHGIKEV